MNKIIQLVNIIRNKTDDMSLINIKSDSFSMNIPISEKDVMCMKVIQLIKDEYDTHTWVEGIEMLLDTIWWMQTIMVAFPSKKVEDNKVDEYPLTELDKPEDNML